jgi:signal peptidase
MRITSFLLKAVLILAIAFVAALALTSKVPATAIEVRSVESDSMEPVIKTGGLVLIMPSEEYAIGDIITFGAKARETAPTTHRIISIRNENGAKFYTTKGDANEDADVGEASAESVVGHVLVTVPYAGYVLAFAKQPLGFLLVVVAPAALLIFLEAFSVFRKPRAVVKKEEHAPEALPQAPAPASERIGHQEEDVPASYARPRVSMGKF